MKNTFILFLFAALILSGCRKQVSDYEYPDFDPRPTLNAILSQGQPVWVQVSLAQCLDSVHPAACTDAEVLFYVDGQFVERLQHGGEGFYYGETTAEALHEYACKVIIPGFDTLFAQTEMPETPVVTGIEIMENATVDDEGNPCAAVLVTFNNNPNRKTYYKASIEARFEYLFDAGLAISTSHIGFSINTDDPVLLNEGSGRLLFSNEIIRDTVYTLKVNTGMSGYGFSGISIGAYTRSGYVVVNMHGVSESAYRYLKSEDANESLDANTGLLLGVITPVNLYGNVENGRGVFAAIAPMTCDTVFLED